MDNITPLRAIAAISSIGSSTSQGKGRSDSQQQPAQGQLLKGLVVEAQGNNRFVLDIGGTRQSVSSDASLSPGQSLRLQVIKTEPQIELQIVSNPIDQLQGRSLTLLGKNIDLAGLFRQFQQLTPPPLETISPTSRSTLENFFSLQQNGVEGKNGGVILKYLIDTLGINLEQLLARGDKNGAANTLKAALLEIANSFKTASNIAETTNKILTTLELFQLTQIQVGKDTQLILPLPLPFVEQGYLIIEQDDKDSEAGDTTSSENRFSLHLTVSELGNLQIDFLQNMEGLFIRFRAGDQEKADFIETFSTELKKAITEIPLISITFSGDATDPIHDLVRQLVPKGNSILDTKV
ncbi:MAG: hypothetical protein GY799_24880 [Desulfobulbaceae bacterium]|nr:hypothetical protein [Desulfobulbaceae bacterium]